MEKVRLQFQSAEELVRFQKAISCCAYRIDMPNLILTCECDPTAIATAIAEYAAQVIELPFSLL